MMNLFTLSMYTVKMKATGWLIPIGLGFGTAVSFIFGEAPLGWIFFGVLILDFITGVMASLKRGEKFNSAKLRNMFFKWAAYLSILLVAACLDIVMQTVWLHAAALGWVILSEGVSCLENAEEVLGKKIPFLAKLRKLLDAIRNGDAK